MTGEPEDFVSHAADRKPVRVEPPAVDPGCPTASGECRDIAKPSTVTADGSAYGHRGLALMRPVIVPLTSRWTARRLLHQAPQPVLRCCQYRSEGEPRCEMDPGTEGQHSVRNPTHRRCAPALHAVLV